MVNQHIPDGEAKQTPIPLFLVSFCRHTMHANQEFHGVEMYVLPFQESILSQDHVLMKI